MDSHLRTPILNCLTYLLWAYHFTDCEFSCLAMLTKPYPVCGPAYWSQIPQQLGCMSESGHGVLRTILVARRTSGLSIKSFLLSMYV